MREELYFQVLRPQAGLRCDVRRHADLQRDVYVEQLHTRPNVFVLRNVLSTAELRHVTSTAEDQVRKYEQISQEAGLVNVR